MHSRPQPGPDASGPDNVVRGTVLIIGAGFSGLAMAARLDRAGIRDWLILDHAGSVGGTWRDNTYPGCECDIPSPLYSFSFDQNPRWSRLFAPQPEILRYLEDVVRRHRLGARIRFGRAVTTATWSDTENTWTVTTAGGECYVVDFLVSAVGLLHRPKVPDLPGLPDFRGRVFHSARWDHDHDLTGQRVAVVGTGASAIQFVPAIARDVAALTVFQRSAPWILPKPNREFAESEKRTMARYPWRRWYRRARLYWQHEQRAAGFTDIAADNGKTVQYARRHLERQVADPDLRAMLTPDYALGCKRLLISSDYYPVFNQPHVTLRDDGVRKVTPSAVVTGDGETVEVDVIVFGTGFDAQDALAEVAVTGRDGRTLADAWAHGMTAYLGTTVAGFPNFFILCGPNTGLGHNSQVFMIERQVHHAIRAIRSARRRGPIDVTPAAQETFNAWLRSRMASTVWNAGGCTSWYLNPTTGENTLLWPSTTVDFWKKTLRLGSSAYSHRRRTPRTG